jgi:electron transfer flavoprotein alpha subunit
VTVLVLVEHDRGAVADGSLQALTGAREVAAATGEAVEAVAVGGGNEEAVAAVAGFGAETLHLVNHTLLSDYGPDAWAEAILQLADHLDVEVIMAMGTDRGNEVMAQIAARTDAPFVANCVSVEPDEPDEPWRLTRLQWGGSLLEDVDLVADRKLLSLAPHSVAAEPGGDDGELRVAVFEPDLDPSVTITMVVDREEGGQGVTLATAPVVIGGGRGVGSAEGFAPLEELAGLLGGVVGCSRAVTNNGWRAHADQVGQTGTRIAPDIYVATGISGAVQHWVGAAASKTILAVNTDPEANMVAKAAYAVIGDLHEVVPAISAEIRRRNLVGRAVDRPEI